MAKKINYSGNYAEVPCIILTPMSQAGAPTTGTWAKGSKITDTNGTEWECTVAGTPGTWKPVFQCRTFDTVANAELASGANNDICYVQERQAFYRYDTSASITRDGDLILNTSAGGTTRWKMTQKVSRTQGDTGWIQTGGATLSTTSTTTARLTLSSTAVIAIRSIRYELAAGNYDITLSGSAGAKYVGFNDGTGTLYSQDSLWDFNTQVPVMVVYWDGAAIKAAPQTEFHGIRDTVWHRWAHVNIGCIYRSGMTFTGSVQTDNNTDPGVDTCQYLWSTDGVIYDEDVAVTPGIGAWLQTLGSGLTSGTAAILPFLYYNGSTVVSAAAMADRTPFIHAGGNTAPQWNNAGTLTAAVTGEYVVYHYFASPMTNGWAIFARPHNAVFASLTAAKAANPSQLTWTEQSEIKHIYTAIFRVNTTWAPSPSHGCKLVALDDYRNTAGSPVAGVSATSHNALSDRSAPGSHPAAAIYGTTDGGVQFHNAATNGLLSDASLVWDTINKQLSVGVWSDATSQVRLYGTNGRILWDAAAGTMFFDRYGANTQYIGRRANGTQVSPTALATGDTIACFAGRGYGTEFQTENKTYMSFNAAQDWTGANQGSHIRFYTTANNTITADKVMQVEQDGSLWVKTFAAGSSDTVITRNAGTGYLEQRTIDARVWGSSLADGSGAPDKVAYWNDTNTLTYNTNFHFDSSTISLGLGSSSLTGIRFRIGANHTGAAVSYGSYLAGTIQSDVVTRHVNVYSALSTQATSWVLPDLQHFSVSQGTIGAGSSITAQYGFVVNSTMSGASSNIAFSGAVPASATNWNIYMAGTAQNYFAGNVGIGITVPAEKLHVIGNAMIGNATVNFVNTPLLVSGTLNGILNKTIQNSSNGNSASASNTLFADNGSAAFLRQQQYSSGNTGTLFGITLANYSSITNGGASVEGLLIGTTTEKPLVFGTNSSERARILSDGKVGIGTATPLSLLHVASTGTTSPRGILTSQHNSGTQAARLHFNKSRGTLESQLTINTGDALGALVFAGYEGTSYKEMGQIQVVATGTIGTDRVPTYMTFSTATDAAPSVLTEAMRIGSDQRIGIGTTATTYRINAREILANVTDNSIGYMFRTDLSATTANNTYTNDGMQFVYYADDGADTGYTINSIRSMVGAAYSTSSALITTMYGMYFAGGCLGAGNISNYSAIFAGLYGTGGGKVINATGLTIGNLSAYNMDATSTTIGININASSNACANKYGIYINALSGGTSNNFAIYTAGTMPSVFSGNVSIGTNTVGTTKLRVAGSLTGSTSIAEVYTSPTVQSDVTGNVYGFLSELNTVAATFTLSSYFHFYASQGTIGLNSTITQQYGFYVPAGMVGGSQNYGFVGAIPAGTNRWNIYMGGTAQNYLNGNTGFGIANPAYQVHLYKSAADTYAVIENTGNTYRSVLGFRRERSDGTGMIAGALWSPSDTSTTKGVFVINARTSGADVDSFASGNTKRLTFDTTLGIYFSELIAAAEYKTLALLNGRVGIGEITSPTAALHIKGGSGSANECSLKINTGTLVGTPESGAIENDGTHLYWTDSGGTRRVLDGTADAWEAFGSVTWASSSTFTVTDNATNQAIYAKGRPLRYRLAGAGTNYYGIVTNYVTGTVTIAGVSLGATTQAISMDYGAMAKAIQIEAGVGGAFAQSGAQTAMLNDLEGRPLAWRSGAAYLVRFGVRANQVDSGANQTRVNVRLGSTSSDYVSTNNSNAGIALVNAAWAYTVVGISSSMYDLTLDDTIELKCDDNGTNKDSSELTVSMTFILA